MACATATPSGARLAAARARPKESPSGYCTDVSEKSFHGVADVADDVSMTRSLRIWGRMSGDEHDQGRSRTNLQKY